MSHVIIHRDGVFNVYSTIVDAPLLHHAVDEGGLREFLIEQATLKIDSELPRRLDRAKKTGCSSRISSGLSDCIRLNCAGPDNVRMLEAEFISRFLTPCQAEFVDEATRMVDEETSHGR